MLIVGVGHEACFEAHRWHLHGERRGLAAKIANRFGSEAVLQPIDGGLLDSCGETTGQGVRARNKKAGEQGISPALSVYLTADGCSLLSGHPGRACVARGVQAVGRDAPSGGCWRCVCVDGDKQIGLLIVAQGCALGETREDVASAGQDDPVPIAVPEDPLASEHSVQSQVGFPPARGALRTVVPAPVTGIENQEVPACGLSWSRRPEGGPFQPRAQLINGGQRRVISPSLFNPVHKNCWVCERCRPNRAGTPKPNPELERVVRHVHSLDCGETGRSKCFRGQGGEASCLVLDNHSRRSASAVRLCVRRHRPRRAIKDQREAQVSVAWEHADVRERRRGQSQGRPGEQEQHAVCV